jgi:ATP-dependent helicase/nuclease subunit A
MSALADQAVRDAAEHDLGSTLFVEAGAGTGKTTMLVGRVVSLVMDEGVRLDQIAAITFTEAAAAELRDRLAQTFEELAADGNEEARSALTDLDAATVTTLHGFARKVLAEHPFAIGLPPLFDVADQSSARVAFDERWEQLTIELLERPEHAALTTRALSCGLKWDQLRAVALVSEENWDRLALLEPPPEPPPIEVHTLRSLLEGALACRGQCLYHDDKLLEFLDTTIASSAEIVMSVADDPLDALQVLRSLPKLTKSVGQKGNWADKQYVMDLLTSAEEERSSLIDHTVQWVLQSLFRLIVLRTLAAAEERRVSGHLTFHDLLVLARRLVAEHPEARLDLHQRYRYLLIDEFQDTDPIQVELAMLIAADPQADVTRHWAELPVEPGRLFFVGDPKQSIYRFRRADIDVFLKTRDEVVGAVLSLTTNFRSRPAIVAWVNRVIGAIFFDNVPGRQAGYTPLTPGVDHGPDDPGRAPVVLFGLEPLPGKIDDVRRSQAKDIAQAIATLHAQGWLVRDQVDPTGAARPVRLADVAVLIRARSSVRFLEAAFRAAGVPYRLEASSLVYDSDEVRQLLGILRAVADPTDAVSTLAALRSSAFACGDDDLFRFKSDGGSWDWRRAGSGDPVSDALADIRHLHESAWWQGVSGLVSQVVSDRRLLALALTETRPREAWRRIRFLVDQARLFDEATGGDLRAFLRWVDHQQAEGAQVKEAILPETDDDAVRVVTIHAAKGLEYPVVALVGLEAKADTDAERMLFVEATELNVGKDFRTPGFAAANALEKEIDAAERQRLLYVAATRARDVLLVSVHRKEKDTANLAAHVMAQCEACPELWIDGTFLLAAAAPVPRREKMADLSNDTEAARDEFMAERDRLLARARQPRTISATAVASLLRAAQVPEAPEESADRPEGSTQRRGRAGTAIGRAVHGVLQVIDLATGEGLEALVQAQAVAEGVSDRTPEIARLVRSALESDVVRRAVSGGRYWRELYIGVPVGQRVLEGFIDLLYETPEGLVVVDYKTDRIDPNEVEARYRWQGGSYALAVETALGRPVVGCTFLILGAGGAESVSVSDLPSVVTEVSQALGVAAATV